MPQLLLEFAEEQPRITKTDAGRPDQNMQQFCDPLGLSHDSSEPERVPWRNDRRGPTAVNSDRSKFEERPKQTLPRTISLCFATNRLQEQTVIIQLLINSRYPEI